MTPNPHTYGCNCRLAPLPLLFNEVGMPQVASQFFYSSTKPINELLSKQGYSSTSDTKPVKRQLRPFDRGDNNALEKAWMSLSSDHCRSEHDAIREGQYGAISVSQGLLRRRQKLVTVLASKHLELHAGALHPLLLNENDTSTSAEMDGLSPCCPALRSDISEMLQLSFCALLCTAYPEFAIEDMEREVIDVMLSTSQRHALSSEQDSVSDDMSAKRRDPTSPEIQAAPATAVGRLATRCGRPRSSSGTTSSSLGQINIDVRGSTHLPGTRVGPPGKPFIQAGGKSTLTTPDSLISGGRQQLFGKRHSDDSIAFPQDERGSKKDIENDPSVLDVVVVNDVAVVMRATWFYRDTMMPVAPLVANQLEAGYQELQPWTETWGDELKCAVEVGSLGEEKISHCLWPQDSKYFSNTMQKREPKISTKVFCSAHCCRGDAAAQGSLDPVIEGCSSNTERISRAFANFHVIYKDEKLAFLLKPSLRPSAYYGRRPASKIVKGFTVGIPIVRGFDPQAWERIHGRCGVSAPDKETTHTYENNEGQRCDACEAEKDEGQVTDLILVAHGIGQKFAERVESFHFTHAINGFRRAVNDELRNPIIQRLMRQGQNGVMILPLNWRVGLSFEDGGPASHQTSEHQMNESFGLKDIEPNTIPAVRSMISDVMFDIPFYMSHHKSKMISALVFEANRVYRLWCRNNPGFADRGRVHIIAHSLGSVMAVDILSRQPTEVPRLDLKRTEPETQFFEFDTTNLFLLGSPAGFFLLLEHGSLTPRRGRQKPGADPRDIMDQHIVSDAGKFGCLAVDNIYNILAKEDPIAYLLNGAVDPAYAAALKPAYVPSTSTSIFKSMGDVMRLIVPGLSLPTDPLVTHPERPSRMRLPSQLELEVHDFTREEIAEKKAFLLNDNGQIDWFLRSGNGPLEIQYLNMLSAHTSYWINQDFVRMLCLEIGRRPGRNFSVPGMRAMKKTKQFSLET
ncbi:DDHD domain protein [Metarhizium album ARSEF 1941]|uniref:DDHD domain protein n=1 Tax=Metarhizium album (strain ARSEF 1941) TaxID=1081103 RepID=A0A0B2WYB9_METAS|nr:DDHD domain protein [Metarhizium album ARSEF 1941]KHN97840.1 DDHD domain protein [Metarhizium album ARSEF 1941]